MVICLPPPLFPVGIFTVQIHTHTHVHIRTHTQKHAQTRTHTAYTRVIGSLNTLSRSAITPILSLITPRYTPSDGKRKHALLQVTPTALFLNTYTHQSHKYHHSNQ
jgi:hypothetical protein